MYGHLGLILTTTQYSTLSNISFVHLVNPGPLDPPEKGTEAQINATHDVKKERHCTLHLSQAVKKALISQVVSAMKPPYLAALCSTHKSHYGDNILTVLRHLFSTYGHITHQQLNAIEMEFAT